MNLLLDTHLLLWAAGRPDRLSIRARRLITASDNQLLFSSASLWEIAVKNALKRPDFNVDTRRLWRLLLAHGYREMPVSSEHAIAVELAKSELLGCGFGICGNPSNQPGGRNARQDVRDRRREDKVLLPDFPIVHGERESLDFWDIHGNTDALTLRRLGLQIRIAIKHTPTLPVCSRGS